ncbi:hypothetical protein GCM10009718_20680 [Isoptericola halotolerans]
MDVSPSVTWTHDLTFSDTDVRERYAYRERGEADRERKCLTMLATHAPGFASRPLRRDVEERAPVIMMERLPGASLGGRYPGRIAETDAACALRRAARHHPCLRDR